MIEINGKYKLKKIKGFDNNDERDYTVIEIYDNETILCKAPDGEKYFFMKDFLIDPDKPDEIYSDITFERSK